MSLLKLAQKARKINVRDLALQIARQNAGLISNRVQQQLTVGEAGDGRIVGKYKSPYYARLKARISSAPSGVVDLKLSGSLHKGLNTDISKSKFETNSSVDYSKYQIDRYGKRIYELQKDNKEDIKFKNSFDTVKEYSRLLEI